jgi:ATP-binding protein involved in chromosome partitioning
MNELNQDMIYEALSKVMDPELKKDLVTLKMVKDVQINDSIVSVSIQLTTPACPLRNKIKNDVENAVMNVPGVKQVDVDMGATVSDDGKEREVFKLPVKNAIAIASGKGGVGKSTVAVNIAVSLAQRGAKVGLLDADIYGPNIPTMMGIDELPLPENDRIQPAEAFGVKVMSIGFMVRPGQPLIWRGPLLHSAIRQFLSDVDWGELDYLIVDLPPGTGDVQLSLSEHLALSGGVIVTLPQAVSLEDASRGLEMFNKLNVPVLGVIENMSYLALPTGEKMDIFGTGGGERLAKAARVQFLGGIPMDPAVRVSCDMGMPIVLAKPDSDAAKIFEHITELLAGAISVTAFINKTTGKK